MFLAFLGVGKGSWAALLLVGSRNHLGGHRLSKDVHVLPWVFCMMVTSWVECINCLVGRSSDLVLWALCTLLLVFHTGCQDYRKAQGVCTLSEACTMLKEVGSPSPARAYWADHIHLLALSSLCLALSIRLALHKKSLVPCIP